MMPVKTKLLNLFTTTLFGVFLYDGASAVTKKYIAVTQIISHKALDATREGLKESILAYAEENQIDLIWVFENAQGNIATASQIAHKFVGSSPDIIVAISTPSAQTIVKAAQGTKIPIVFSAV